MKLMINWIETIRQKPEGTRRAIAFVLFIFLSALIITIWLWNLQGAFPYEDLSSTNQSLRRIVDQGTKNFQEFRYTLGELKQKITESVYTQTEGTADPVPTN